MKFSAVAFFMLVASPAMAQTEQQYLRVPDSNSRVFVWKNLERMNDGLKMIEAGVHRSNRQMVLGNVACTVTSGTKVVVLETTQGVSRVAIPDGVASGCRGVVDASFVGSR